MRIFVQGLLFAPCFIGSLFVVALFIKIAVDSILGGTAFDLNEWIPGVAAIIGVLGLTVSIFIPDGFSLSRTQKVILALCLLIGMSLASYTLVEGLVAGRTTVAVIFLLASPLVVALWNIKRLRLVQK